MSESEIRGLVYTFVLCILWFCSGYSTAVIVNDYDNPPPSSRGPAHTNTPAKGDKADG